MQHALLVRRGQPGAQLAREFERLGWRQPADPSEQRRPGPRRPRTPSRGSGVPRPPRCRTRGRRGDATPGARRAPRRGSGSSAAGSRSTRRGRNFSATGVPSLRSSARYTSPMPPRPSSADHAVASGDHLAGRECGGRCGHRAALGPGAREIVRLGHVRGILAEDHPDRQHETSRHRAPEPGNESALWAERARTDLLALPHQPVRA